MGSAPTPDGSTRRRDSLAQSAPARPRPAAQADAKAGESSKPARGAQPSGAAHPREASRPGEASNPGLSLPSWLRPESDSLLSRVWHHPLADYHLLLGATLILVALGLVMVLSASSVVSMADGGSSYDLFLRQLLFACVGIPAMFWMSRRSTSSFRKAAYPLIIISFVLLVLVLIPGIGISVYGQRNWLPVGMGFRLQPSEIAKLALIIFCADLLARKQRSMDQWRHLLIPMLPLGLLFLGLVVLEGDVGTTLVMAPILGVMFFVAGAPLRLFAWLGGLALGMVALLSVAEPYRVKRFLSWLDPASDPMGTGWQLMHGQYALATGGWWGVGLGGSREKWGALPEAHTDFIFAVIGEELGLFGTVTTLALFAVIAIVGFRIVVGSKDVFVKLATAGVMGWVIVQATINIGAVIGIMPITGLPLPLVSYGGSSLLLVLIAIGMLLSFTRQEPEAAALLAGRETEKSRRRRARARAGTASARTDAAAPAPASASGEQRPAGTRAPGAGQ